MGGGGRQAEVVRGAEPPQVFLEEVARSLQKLDFSDDILKNNLHFLFVLGKKRGKKTLAMKNKNKWIKRTKSRQNTSRTRLNPRQLSRPESRDQTIRLLKTLIWTISIKSQIIMYMKT